MNTAQRSSSPPSSESARAGQTHHRRPLTPCGSHEERLGGWASRTSKKEVYKPTETGTAKLVEAPKDLAGWLQNHPYIETSKPEPITVGGDKGEQFDVVLGDLPEGYFGCVWLGLCGPLQVKHRFTGDPRGRI